MSGFFSRLFQRAAPAILEAKPRDAGVCARLHALSFPVGWSEGEIERLLSEPPVIAHLARGDGGRGKPLGFLMSRMAADEAEILSVAVDPAARGQGLAGELLRHHLSRIAARGVRKIFLEVGENNEPALRLYRKAGFHEVGKRPNYYTGGREGAVSALVLKRELA